MSDLISRQAAIDAKQEFRNPNVVRDTEARTAYDRTYANGWNDCNSAWINAIKALPSAQPEGCPFYIRNIHDRGDDSLCRLFHSEVKCLAVETRQVGKWIYEGVRGRFPACRCSVCGNVENADWAIISGSVNYCPNCGAKMEVEG